MNYNLEQEYIKEIDLTYSYQLAKRMEENRSNPKLGYRSAGSEAEIATGNMLAEEMRRIGLAKVRKDKVQVDAWEFHRAELTYVNEAGETRNVILGAYQTTFITDGIEKYPLISVGKGTRKDYDGIDVKGKLVLVEINQRDEWWINYPVYQAYRKGAVAVLAMQTGGYGEADDDALNAQDIAGPAHAVAFSISRTDARALQQTLKHCPDLMVGLDAYTKVTKNQSTYNIVGEIPGKNPERFLLLSAHYDSYFNGFQDDNTAISMMLNIGKTLIQIGYQPENTILFCAMAAEEWGVENSPFDWSTGAYEEVFHAHPEWRGKVIADLNFELPAYAHGTRARIRSTYEYQEYLEDFLNDLPELTVAYPEETRITAPIETWSDDFSIAIAGIPSMVNDFTGGSFMVTNYHSQFDDDSSYNEDVYRMHHELFGILLMALDHTKVIPLNFQPVFQKAAKELDLEWCEDAKVDGAKFLNILGQASSTAGKVFQQVKRWNEYNGVISEEEQRKAEQCEKTLLQLFQMEQDAFVRIDWYGNVRMPHVCLQQNLEMITGAAKDLEIGNLSAALRKLYQINNNCYAFMFEEEVYQHFTEYALNQTRDRLKWGYGRIVGYVNLYGVVHRLLEKEETGATDYSEEILFLKKAAAQQLSDYKKCINDLIHQVEKMNQLLLSCL